MVPIGQFWMGWRIHVSNIVKWVHLYLIPLIWLIWSIGRNLAYTMSTWMTLPGGEHQREQHHSSRKYIKTTDLLKSKFVNMMISFITFAWIQYLHPLVRPTRCLTQPLVRLTRPLPPPRALPRSAKAYSPVWHLQHFWRCNCAKWTNWVHTTPCTIEQISRSFSASFLIVCRDAYKYVSSQKRYVCGGINDNQTIVSSRSTASRRII